MSALPEKKIQSINMMIVKNTELLNAMSDLVAGVAPDVSDYEAFIVKTEFGNKYVEGAIEPPDVFTMLAPKVEDLYAKIQENNTAIKQLIRELPQITLTEEEIIAMYAAIGITYEPAE